MLKRNQGITLIALVVTIIVLLILAGVTLSFVAGENGILQSTGKVDWQTESSGENIGNTSNLITQAKLIINDIGATTVQLKVETLATESDNIKEYQVFLNNQLKGTFEEAEIEINDLKINTEYSIFVKVIDKEEKSRISNTEKITTKHGTYLFQEGECQDITSGWTLSRDAVSTVSIVDNIIYARRFGGANGGWAISTNQAIDITNYTKLCCKYTAGSLEWNDGLRLRLGKTKYIYMTGGLSVSSGTHSSDSFEYNKTEAIFKWDISQIPQDSYFIGVGGSGATDTYIYSIWLE